MMEEKLPRCGIKACPHITSRIKTLKKLWQTTYDMVYGTNTSGFGWDPDTKCVTANKEVWDEYIKSRLLIHTTAIINPNPNRRPLEVFSHQRTTHTTSQTLENLHSLPVILKKMAGENDADRLKELGITMEDVRTIGSICLQSDGVVEMGVKYKTKEDYDTYEGAAK
ncbi:hypothetical protein K1719_044252 [Acacia pycnantha]|nr:hypothetical protein K1719_044252 [Acacia pycnantha]